MNKTFTWMLCLSLAFGMLSGCGSPGNGPDTPAPVKTAAAAQQAVYLSSYDQAYAAIQTAAKNQNGRAYGLMRSGAAMNDAAEAPMEPEAAPEATMMAPQGEDAGGMDYSGTNVQVDGIDEQDIVKTDGQYIYLLRSGELVILRAAGADTEVLSQTQIGIDWQNEAGNEQEYSEQYKWPSGMYVANGRVIVLSSCYSYHSYRENDVWNYDSQDYTCVDLYDVSDPEQPVLAESLGQDGSLQDSRLNGDRLYLVTGWYADDPQAERPETYVPAVYRGGERSLIAPGDICICPRNESARYTNVSVINVNAGEIEKTQSLLGGGDTVYMNDASLYLANSVTRTDESDPYTKSVYTVVDYENTACTELIRFDIADGTLTYVASGEVDGFLHDQYSMDEQDGNLRIVTTASSYHYSVYTDEEMDFTNYVSGDSAGSNALYILDPSLDVIGSITDLAPDEQVYSVRFNGDYGYFCTFETVDPLFAVDLSEPTAPKVLSALKIPGFSDYLHVWSDGRLFGLGQNTRTEGQGDDQWITTDGMKLSMFDTSDPTDVTECANLALDADYSEALYNPRAILVSHDRNLIAFPADDGYLIYGYDEQDGFALKAEVQLDDGFAWNSRGLYIGDLFYVVSEERVSVIDLNSLALTATIPIARG